MFVDRNLAKSSNHTSSMSNDGLNRENEGKCDVLVLDSVF